MSEEFGKRENLDNFLKEFDNGNNDNFQSYLYGDDTLDGYLLIERAHENIQDCVTQRLIFINSLLNTIMLELEEVFDKDIQSHKETSEDLEGVLDFNNFINNFINNELPYKEFIELYSSVINNMEDERKHYRKLTNFTKGLLDDLYNCIKTNTLEISRLFNEKKKILEDAVKFDKENEQNG